MSSSNQKGGGPCVWMTLQKKTRSRARVERTRKFYEVGTAHGEVQNRGRLINRSGGKS